MVRDENDKLRDGDLPLDPFEMEMATLAADPRQQPSRVAPIPWPDPPTPAVYHPVSEPSTRKRPRRRACSGLHTCQQRNVSTPARLASNSTSTV